VVFRPVVYPERKAGRTSMSGFWNKSDNLRDESIFGLALAHSQLVRIQPDPLVVLRRVPKAASKVQIISGGGSGHEPMDAGFVGLGMLDAACPGQIFSSPSPEPILSAVRACESTAGHLFIVKNFDGDRLNFGLARDSLNSPAEIIVVADEAVENSAGEPRGMAGTLFVQKVAGAAAERGASLQQCAAIANRAAAAVRSNGVALSSCHLPNLGRPTFKIAEGEVEFDVGIHGERGRNHGPWRPLDDLMERMTAQIVLAMETSPSRGLLLVNGMGATPPLQLYAAYGAAHRQFTELGWSINRSIVGTFVTSLDMAGVSITLCRLDDELTDLWDAAVKCPAFQWG